MRTQIWSLVLSCCLTFSLGASEVYKWVDENGVVHFTDRPPQDQPFDEMDVQDHYPPGNEAQGESVYDEAVQQQKMRRELRIQQQEQEAEERKQVAEEKAADEANCARAIHYLNSLQLQCPVFFDGAGVLRVLCPGYYFAYEGDRTYVDDKEREELIEYYRRQVESCKEGPR